MKIFKLSILLLFINFNLIQSQNLSYDLAGSLNNSNFTKGLNADGLMTNTDLSKASVTPAINLTSVNEGSVTVSINLSYNLVKNYEDPLTNAGFGWNINEGGTIKRVIRGKRDDSYYNVASTYATDVLAQRGWLDFLNGSYPTYGDDANLYFSAGKYFGDVIRNDYNWYNNNPALPPYNFTNARYRLYYNAIHNHMSIGRYDTEPDIFEFTFGGTSGKFVFDENGLPVLIPYQDIRIEPALGANGGSSWIFLTQDGTKYIFENNASYTETSHVTFLTGLLDDPATSFEDESKSETEYISTWHLSRIETFNGASIEFVYQTLQSQNYSIENTMGQHYIPLNVDLGVDPTNNNPNNITVKCHYNATIKDPKYLKSINTNSKKIVFDGFPVTSVKTFSLDYNNTNYLQQFFELKYGWFKDQSCNNLKSKLTSLQQNAINGTDKLMYRFIYESGVLEAKTKFLPATFVTTPSGTSYDYNLAQSTISAKTFDTKNSRIKEVVLPSGGSMEYEYDPQFYKSVIKTVLHQMWMSSNANDITTRYIYDNYTHGNSTSGYKLNKSYIFHYDYPTHSYNDLDHSLYLVARNSDAHFSSSYDEFRYGKVIVLQSGNGSIEYEFTDFNSNPDEIPYKQTSTTWITQPVVLNSLLRTPVNVCQGYTTDMSFERGLVKKIVYKNANGLKIKEVENIYEFNPSGYAPKEVVALSVFSHNFFKVYTSTPPADYELEFYKHKSKWFYLSSTSERTYDISNPTHSLQVVKTFNYDNLSKQLVSVSDLSSAGVLSKTYFKYVKDYNLQNINILSDEAYAGLYNLYYVKGVNIPVQVTQTITKGGVEKLITSNCTLFNLQGLPHLEYSIQLKQPIDISQADIFKLTEVNYSGTPHLVLSPLFKLKHTIVSYSLKKKIVETVNEYGIHESLILDDHFQSMKASFVNASVSGDECFIADFEGNTAQWSTTLSNQSHTGEKGNRVSAAPDPNTGVYSYSFAKTLYPVNFQRKFKASCWIRIPSGYGGSQTGELVIKAVNAQATALTISGAYCNSVVEIKPDEWRYYETIIDYPDLKSRDATTAGFSVYVVNYNAAGYFDVDDIRIQPLQSECSSQTLDPTTRLQTSASNNRSMPFFKEYDGFGRIKLIRNDKKEILSETIYDINSRSCEYWNDDACMMVTRDDCANPPPGNGNNGSNSAPPDPYHGYYTEPVLYHIPANRYFSCNTQADVDAQVQNEFSANSQLYANSYGQCLPCLAVDHVLIGNECLLANIVLDSMDPCDNQTGLQTLYFHYDYFDGQSHYPFTMTMPCGPQ